MAADVADDDGDDMRKQTDATPPRVVDLFGGPGGWDQALAALGITDIVGIEWDDDACATRRAAGHATVQGDVAALDPLAYEGVDGMIASPPCPSFSRAGKRLGIVDKPTVRALLDGIMSHDATASEFTWHDERSALSAEALRWALALRPRWIACEQVVDALELWEWTAEHLRTLGYSVWVGVLSAEQYGVPQTRKRAILIARRDGVEAAPPRATHQRFVPGRKDRSGAVSLFDLAPERIVHADDRVLTPWISMGEALDWDFEGELDSGQTTQLASGRVEKYTRFTSMPAPTATGKSGRQWVVRLVANAQTNACVRTLEEPAPTIKGGHDAGDRRWVFERPATTVLGTNRIAPPGHHERQYHDSLKVTPEQASVLQTFPPHYPWQGRKGSIEQQIGNAVPPLLAEAILAPLVEPIPGFAR